MPTDDFSSSFVKLDRTGVVNFGIGLSLNLMVATGNMELVCFGKHQEQQPGFQHSELSTRKMFKEFRHRWREETSTPSTDFAAIVMNSAYQRIISLGWDAVPLILEELKVQPDHWGWALEAITGVNPVPPEAEGDIDQIGTAWLQWGRDRRLTA